MSTTTQYNPNLAINERLLAAGASKTVYAMVNPRVEIEKMRVFGESSFLADRAAVGRQHEYLDMFRHAWTGKQDAYHVEFFDRWHKWSAPVVDLDRNNFPFYYPCNGASEPIRHVIFNMAAGTTPSPHVHVFEGEYEGYKAMAEAAYLGVHEHKRENWQSKTSDFARSYTREWDDGDLFFISAPSAIDGNVWTDFNAFLAAMPPRSVVVDVTYVGAVPESAINERFNLNSESVHSVIFSLSKPFGVYYDRIGGIFMRDEDPGLFGNKWFKNLTSLAIGNALLAKFGVFDLPNLFAQPQKDMVQHVREELGLDIVPSDVFILAHGTPGNDEISAYLTRAGKLRVCLTPGMVEMVE